MPIDRRILDGIERNLREHPSPRGGISKNILTRVEEKLSEKPSQGRLSHAANAWMQSLINIPGDFMQGAAVQAQEDGRRELNKSRAFHSFFRKLVRGKDSNYEEAPRENPTDSALYKKGKNVKDFAKNSFPTNPEYQGDFLTDTLPRAGGSVAGYTGAALLGRGIGLAPAMTVGTLGATQTGVQSFNEALAKTGDLDKAYQAFNMSLPVGATEGVPIGRALGVINKASKGGISKILVRGFKGGLEELVQEVVQTLGQNFVAKSVYDPERQITKGLVEQGGAGFTVGGALNILTEYLGQRKARGKSQKQSVMQPQAGDDGIDVAITPAGTRVPVRYEVLEAEVPITSNNLDMSVNPAFPKELQPRDRQRASSQIQVHAMANTLQPELLGRSSSAVEGAPIIGADGVVESGNGRILALRHVYDQALPGAKAYRQYLKSLGVDIRRFKKPVLIRRRLNDMTHEERMTFVGEANARVAMGLPPSEQASLDAEGLTVDTLTHYQGGRLESGNNAIFVRQWAKTLPQAEFGNLVDKQGILSQEGKRRLENAIFHQAYDAENLLNLRAESLDNNLKSILNSLYDVAPSWAKMRASIAESRIKPEAEITPHLLRAVDIVKKSRDDKSFATDIVAQKDFLNNAPSEETKALLRLMFHDTGLTKPVARPVLARALQEYVAMAEHLTTEQTLIANKTTPLQILQAVERQHKQGVFEDEAISMMEPGKKYIGSIKDKPGSGTQKVGSPLRRERIIRNLLSALDLPLYTGHIGKRTLLGFFRPSNEEMRIRNANDIETLAHEVAHALEKRIPSIMLLGANESYQREMKGLTYNVAKPREGFAEFIRLWMTQPDVAQDRAPNHTAWMNNFVKTHEYGVPLRKARKQMTEWFEQDALDRAVSKISTNPSWLQRSRDRVQDFTENFSNKKKQGIFDDLHSIRAMENEIVGEKSSVPGGVYESARLTRGVKGVIEGALRFGAPKILDNGDTVYVGKGLAQILAPLEKNTDKFWYYAVGRSSMELHGQGRERLFTENEAKALMALETPLFKEVFKEYQTWNNHLLNFAEKSGVLNPATRAAFRRTQYMPFFRVLGEQKIFKQATQNPQKLFRTLHGGTANLNDIQMNVLSSAAQIIEASIINKARQNVVNLSRKDRGGHFLVEIPSVSMPISVDTTRFVRPMLRAFMMSTAPHGITPAVEKQLRAFNSYLINTFKPFTQMYIPNQAPQGTNIITVLHEGKPHYYEVADPLLFRALTNLRRKSFDDFMTRTLAMGRRGIQKTITLYPDFMTVNIVRDSVMSMIMSKANFRPLVESASGLMARIKTDQDYRDYIANGGGYTSFYTNSPSAKRKLYRMAQKKGITPESIIDSPARLMDMLGTISDAIEMAARLGEYKRARTQGLSRKEAAYLGREVSTDFSMRGDAAMIQWLGETALFFRASMASLYRISRGVASDKQRRRVRALTMLIGGLSGVLYLMNRGNPLFEDLEDWERNVYWHFYIPTTAYFDFKEKHGKIPETPKEAYGLYVHFRLPKIWEVGAVSTTAERVLEGIFNNDSSQAKKIATAWTEVMNMDITPALLKPLVELGFNKNTFTQRPIENMSMEGRTPWARSGAYTNRMLADIGLALRGYALGEVYSPAKAQHLVRGYLNSFGTLGLFLTDSARYDDIPDLPITDYPIIRRFFGKDPARGSKSRQELYDFITTSLQHRRDSVWLAKQHDESMGLSFYQKNPEAHVNYEMAKGYKKLLQGQNELLRNIYVSDDIKVLQRFYLQSRRGFPKAIRTVLEKEEIWQSLPKFKAHLIEGVTVLHNNEVYRIMKKIKKKK